MFDTRIRDAAIRARRQRLVFERVRRTLLERRKPLGIEAAYIVGSLRSPDSWRESSDVDVAVAGCSPVVLEIMKALEDASGRVVDVIDLDRHPAPRSFTQSGVKVYG